MFFLSNLSIKTKMIILFLIPTLALLYQVIVVGIDYTHKVNKAEVAEKYLKVAISISAFVHESQKERGLTAGFLGSHGKKFVFELPQQRVKTDAKLQKLRTDLHLLDEEFAKKDTDTEQELLSAMQQIKELASVRKGVSDLSIKLTDAIGYYSHMNTLSLDIIASMIKDSTSAKVSAAMATDVAFLRAKEQMGKERAIGTAAFTAAAIPSALKQKLVAIIAKKDICLHSFKTLAPQSILLAYKKASRDDSFTEVNNMVRILETASKPEDFQGIKGSQFFTAMTRNINLMKQIEDKLAQALTDDLQREKAKISHDRMIMYVETIIILFLVMLLGFLINKNIEQTIANLLNYMQKLSETNDLTLRCPVTSTDEIGDISNKLNALIDSFHSLVADAKNSSNENAAISHELSTTAMGVGKNVEESVEIVNNATVKSQTIKENIIVAVEEAKNSKEDVLKANATLVEVSEDIVKLTHEVQNSADTESELAVQMEALSEDASQVKEVLNVISDIADQTNLLALNAAIEAARAGEHGRGFAVVADEVRKLAERTQKSLTEINATINVIVQAVTDASSAMNNNAQEIQKLSEISEEVETKINETVAAVKLGVEATEKTVADFETTGEDVDSIVTQINEINELSSKNARNVEEIAAAADHLNTMTDNLHTQLETFETK
jgi:methyl-accepting chemotaxis protein